MIFWFFHTWEASLEKDISVEGIIGKVLGVATRAQGRWLLAILHACPGCLAFTRSGSHSCFLALSVPRVTRAVHKCRLLPFLLLPTPSFQLHLVILPQQASTSFSSVRNWDSFRLDTPPLTLACFLHC